MQQYEQLLTLRRDKEDPFCRPTIDNFIRNGSLSAQTLSVSGFDPSSNWTNTYWVWSMWDYDVKEGTLKITRRNLDHDRFELRIEQSLSGGKISGHYKRVLPEGAVDEEHLVSGIDIAPTIADFAGIKEDPGFTGRSLKNLLLTGDARWGQWLTVEHSSSAESKAIVTGDYKYIKMHDPKTGREREYCFDLEKDPQERENIVEDKNVAETIRRFRALASQGGRQMKGAS
jgi:hypothetical protein